MLIKTNNMKIRNIFIICIVSTLMGQFYISPFNTGFRLTLVVFFTSLFLVYFRTYNVIFISSTVGICTFLFRSLIFYLRNDLAFSDVLIQFLPVLSYYFFFGLFFELLKVRENLESPLTGFLSLLVADSLPNIIEASIRKIWAVSDFSLIINQIIIIGILRTSAVIIIYYWIKYYINRLRASEKEKYYRESTILISKLKTELFFLRKSKKNIEDLVSYTHNHYEETKNEKYKAALLKIAKDIHEIKKDYLRVTTGMSAVFDSDSNIKFMSNKDIFDIIEDNAIKLISSKNKDIQFSVECDSLFLTDKFYSTISVLNNLIINSIDAIESSGKINIGSYVEDDRVIFYVEDTGEGISPDKLNVVFKSGYTTKYDAETGKMSTGLGLAHVNNIVTDFFKGDINICSELKKGTKISFTIPRKLLSRKDKLC